MNKENIKNEKMKEKEYKKIKVSELQRLKYRVYEEVERINSLNYENIAEKLNINIQDILDMISDFSANTENDGHGDIETAYTDSTEEIIKKIKENFEIEEVKIQQAIAEVEIKQLGYYYRDIVYMDQFGRQHTHYYLTIFREDSEEKYCAGCCCEEF